MRQNEYQWNKELSAIACECLLEKHLSDIIMAKVDISYVNTLITFLQFFSFSFVYQCSC